MKWLVYAQLLTWPYSMTGGPCEQKYLSTCEEATINHLREQERRLGVKEKGPIHLVSVHEEDWPDLTWNYYLNRLYTQDGKEAFCEYRAINTELNAQGDRE